MSNLTLALFFYFFFFFVVFFLKKVHGLTKSLSKGQVSISKSQNKSHRHPMDNAFDRLDRILGLSTPQVKPRNLAYSPSSSDDSSSVASSMEFSSPAVSKGSPAELDALVYDQPSPSVADSMSPKSEDETYVDMKKEGPEDLQPSPTSIPKSDTASTAESTTFGVADEVLSEQDGVLVAELLKSAVLDVDLRDIEPVLSEHIGREGS
jgi:hypothetical protein